MFDDFDFEADGSISFSEWQRFLLKQKLVDAENKMKGAAGAGGQQQLLNSNLLNSPYDKNKQTDSSSTMQYIKHR